MRTYRTAEVAASVGIHPNTVRLYEDIGLIPKPERQANGYRVFTDFHIEQMKLARVAFQIELLQNGLRKKIIQTVKVSAARNFSHALMLTDEYLAQVRQERDNAEEAIEIAKELLSGRTQANTLMLNRKQASDYLKVSMDALRNWEMNGLLTVKRRANGYRVYDNEDIQRLKIIRSLRCASYSLEAILRMLRVISANPDANIREALNTPNSDEDIISVCDRLISSLQSAEKNALIIRGMLQRFQNKYGIYSV